MNMWIMRKTAWGLRLHKITHSFREIYGINVKLIKELAEYHNMEPIGLGNTMILTDYVQKSLWTMFRG